MHAPKKTEVARDPSPRQWHWLRPLSTDVFSAAAIPLRIPQSITRPRATGYSQLRRPRSIFLLLLVCFAGISTLIRNNFNLKEGKKNDKISTGLPSFNNYNFFILPVFFPLITEPFHSKLKTS